MYLGKDWEVVVGHADWMGRTDIYIINRDNDGVYVAEPIDLVMKLVTEGESAEPTLRLDSFAARALLQALTNAIDKEGIKPPSESYLKGELDATKYHLEDVRAVAGLVAPSGRLVSKKE